MASGFLTGALAGAAGTTALNSATYLDMAVRGRGTSDTPQQMVERVSQVPGSSDPTTWTKQDRVSDVVPHLGYGAVTHDTIAAARS